MFVTVVRVLILARIAIVVTLICSHRPGITSALPWKANTALVASYFTPYYDIVNIKDESRTTHTIYSEQKLRSVLTYSICICNHISSGWILSPHVVLNTHTQFRRPNARKWPIHLLQMQKIQIKAPWFCSTDARPKHRIENQIIRSSSIDFKFVHYKMRSIKDGTNTGIITITLSTQKEIIGHSISLISLSNGYVRFQRLIPGFIFLCRRHICQWWFRDLYTKLAWDGF